MLTDSLRANEQIIKDVVSGLTPGGRAKARAVAKRFERLVQDMKRDFPNDPDAAAGFAFFLFNTARNMAAISEQAPEASGAGIIQMLND